MEDSLPPASPHGQKRQSDDELNGEQRLAKRFNLLNLEQNGKKLYIAVKAESDVAAQPSPSRRRRSNAVTDAMPVEDTKDRVYIHDLDEEIADIESDEERLIFLPDIEKHLMKIPKSVLMGDSQPSQSNEVVLYGVPGSLSVPEEQDVVRKAIAESRARARIQTLGSQTAYDNHHTGDLESTRQPTPHGDDDDDNDIMDVE